MKTSSEYRKFVFFIVLLILFYFAWQVLSFLAVPIIMSFVLSYAFNPVYKKIDSKLKRQWASSFLTVIIILFLVLIPFVFVVTVVADQATSAYLIIKQNVETDALDCVNGASEVCAVYTKVATQFYSNEEFTSTVLSSVKGITNYLIVNASKLIIGLPIIIMKIFITMFLTFFVLIDGDNLAKYVKEVIPFRKKLQDKLFNKMSSVVRAVIYGYVVIGIMQGVIASIGYAIFGINNPILFGTLTGLFAMIPYMGTGIIWIPLALTKIFQSYVAGDNTGLSLGIGLFIYGATAIASMDNFIYPKIVGSRAKVHPAVMLVGILGGLTAFGPVGVFVGPLVLTILLVLLETGLK